MPQCTFSAGFAASGCALPSVGVSKDDIWLFNTSNISSYTDSSGTITALTLATGATGYKMEIEKGSGNTYQERQEDDSSGIDYKHGFEGRIADTSATARTFIDNFNGPDVTMVVRRNDDTFDILGLDEGVRMVRMNESTRSGELGYNFAFEGMGFNYVMKKFLDTDLATTITTLNGYT